MDASLDKLLTIKRRRERAALESLQAIRREVAQREQDHLQAAERFEQQHRELDEYRRALLAGASGGMSCARLRLALDHAGALTVALRQQEDEVRRCAEAAERSRYEVARMHKGYLSVRADTEKIEVQIERARSQACIRAEVLAEAELEEAAA